MEVTRLWQGRERFYMGPSQKLFEYQHTKTEDRSQRSLRNKLLGWEINLPEGEESQALVESLRRRHLNDEAIAKLGLELAAADQELGLPFAAKVMLALQQRFDNEPKRIEVMSILGYSKGEIFDWHLAVDGYAADPRATARLALALEQMV